MLSVLEDHYALLIIFPCILSFHILSSMEIFPGGSDGKASACNVGELGSIPGLGRSPGEGNGNPLQCSCLENPRDRGAWWAAVYGVAQSRTRLKRLSSSSSSIKQAAYLVAQLVKNLPAMQETWIRFLGREESGSGASVSTE